MEHRGTKEAQCFVKIPIFHAVESLITSTRISSEQLRCLQNRILTVRTVYCDSSNYSLILEQSNQEIFYNFGPWCSFLVSLSSFDENKRTERNLFFKKFPTFRLSLRLMDHGSASLTNEIDGERRLNPQLIRCDRLLKMDQKPEKYRPIEQPPWSVESNPVQVFLLSFNRL